MFIALALVKFQTVVAEILTGSAILMPNEVMVLAAPGVDTGKGSVDFKAIPSDQEAMKKLAPRWFLLLDNSWPINGFAPRRSQDCDEFDLDRSAAKGAMQLAQKQEEPQWIAEMEVGSIRRGYIWYVVVSTCPTDIPSSTKWSSLPEPVTIEWRVTHKNNGGELSCDVKYTPIIAVFRAILCWMVLWRQFNFGKTWLQVAIGIIASVDMASTLWNLSYLLFIMMDGEPRYWMVDAALKLDFSVYLALAAVSLFALWKDSCGQAIELPLKSPRRNRSRKKVHKELAETVDSENDSSECALIALGLFVLPLGIISWYFEPWEVNTLSPHMDRVLTNGKPLNCALACIFVAWLVSSIATQAWNPECAEGWYNITISFLGRHVVRLIAWFCSIHARANLGSIINLVLSLMVYASLVRSVESDPLARKSMLRAMIQPWLCLQAGLTRLVLFPLKLLSRTMMIVVFTFAASAPLLVFGAFAVLKSPLEAIHAENANKSTDLTTTAPAGTLKDAEILQKIATLSDEVSKLSAGTQTAAKDGWPKDGWPLGWRSMAIETLELLHQMDRDALLEDKLLRQRGYGMPQGLIGAMLARTGKQISQAVQHAQVKEGSKIMIYTRGSIFGREIPAEGQDTAVCPVTCIFHSDKNRWQNAQAVMYNLDRQPELLQRPGGSQIWFGVQTESEPPKALDASILKQLDVIVSTTMDSLDLEIPANQRKQHMWMPQWRSQHFDDAVFWRPTLSPLTMGRKPHLVWAEDSCDDTTARLSFIQELRGHIQVDSVGSCSRSVEDSAEPPSQLVGQYMFFLALEPYEVSLSDRVYRGLRSGAIPVFRGHPRVREFIPDKDAIIDVDDFPNPEVLASYLNRVANDLSLWVKHTKWRSVPYNVGEHFVRASRFQYVDPFCRVCLYAATKQDPLQTDIWHKPLDVHEVDGRQGVKEQAKWNKFLSLTPASQEACWSNGEVGLVPDKKVEGFSWPFRSLAAAQDQCAAMASCESVVGQQIGSHVFYYLFASSSTTPKAGATLYRKVQCVQANQAGRPS